MIFLHRFRPKNPLHFFEKVPSKRSISNAGSHSGTTFFRRNNSGDRHGVAVVEVALCFPVLLLVTLLFIEFTNLIFLRQSLKVASYEGIRVAVKQGADDADVVEVCASILDARKVLDYEISIEPQDFSILPRGTLTTLTIEVHSQQNQLFGLLPNADDIVSIQSFGLKE